MLAGLSASAQHPSSFRKTATTAGSHRIEKKKWLGGSKMYVSTYGPMYETMSWLWRKSKRKKEKEKKRNITTVDQSF